MVRAQHSQPISQHRLKILDSFLNLPRNPQHHNEIMAR